MRKTTILLLGCGLGLLLAGCKDEEPDFTIKHPPALSLPRLEDEEEDTLKSTVAAPDDTMSIAAAAGSSSLVLSGKILMIDSMLHGRRAPFYYTGVKVSKVWKGRLTGNTIYYISRIPLERKGEQLFFLSATDTGNTLAYSNQLRWQWTERAPLVPAGDPGIAAAFNDTTARP